MPYGIYILIIIILVLAAFILTGLSMWSFVDDSSWKDGACITFFMVDDYSKEYFSPFDELNEDETDHYIEYTGLQIRQQMVDRFNKAIEDKETEVTVECGEASNDCDRPEKVTLYIDYDD